MRPTLPFLLAMAVLLSPGVAAADESVTVNDLVKLSAAGLGDDILIALIESHDTVFKLSADDVLALRERGLSQKVILAMLQTALRPKSRPAEPAPAVAAPVPVPPAPEVEVVPPPQEPPPPVVVNVTQQVEQRVEQPRETERYTRLPVAYPIAVPVYIAPARPQPKPEPVYWGFGGQRRPDTWRDPKKDK